MTTYDRVEQLLNTKHEILTVKLAELKEDTEEIKIHAKETNGHVAANLERIHELEIDQREDNKFKKRSWWIVGSVILLVITEVVSKIIL